MQRKLIRSYRHGFSGFAARLTKEEALALEKRAGVVSVFVDPIYQLHTTRSWDFLKQMTVESEAVILDEDGGKAPSRQTWDTIVGLLDTGELLMHDFYV